jgi:antitoxin PrlF
MDGGAQGLMGGRVASDLRGGEVVVTRADEHEDPAIDAFLNLLEADIRAGRHIPPYRTIWRGPC